MIDVRSSIIWLNKILVGRTIMRKFFEEKKGKKQISIREERGGELSQEQL